MERTVVGVVSELSSLRVGGLGRHTCTAMGCLEVHSRESGPFVALVSERSLSRVVDRNAKGKDSNRVPDLERTTSAACCSLSYSKTLLHSNKSSATTSQTQFTE